MSGHRAGGRIQKNDMLRDNVKVSYYPGCTVKSRARNLEEAAIGSLAVFGVELEELKSWNCCGAVYCLADDDLIHHVASVRTLARVKELGRDKVVTLCSMCYNTLARVNMLMRSDEEKRKRINLFMDREPDYHGEVEVVHFLSFLRDEIGWDRIREKVQKPLQGLKVAPYYGCTLQRPREVGIEPLGSFRIMTEFLEALGAVAVDFPAADICCGSYQVVGNPEAAGDASAKILGVAENAGAEALVMSCPLCEYNVGSRQEELLHEKRIAQTIPTFYFTQLLALALGLDTDACRFDLNRNSCLELLQKHSLLNV